jgi:hypothetical protein
MSITNVNDHAAEPRPTEIARRYLLSAAHKYSRAADLLTSVATMNGTHLTMDERANLILAGREATRNATAVKRLADSVDAPALALVPELPTDDA